MKRLTTWETYLSALADFMVFAPTIDVEWMRPDHLDGTLALFLQVLFDGGRDRGEGERLLAALRAVWPASTPSCLPRSLRALRGWKRVRPPRTRPPLPWPFLALVVGLMLEDGRAVLALALLLMYSAYLRPSELLKVRACDLVGSQGRPQVWALSLHPEERGETSKVNVLNECLLLDSAYLPSLGEALNLIRSPAPQDAFFPIDYRELSLLFRDYQSRAGLPGSYVLYQLRHGGPSNDRLLSLRDLASVKQRGRWRCESSMLRYEAHTRILQEEARATPKTLAAASRWSARLKAELPALTLLALRRGGGSTSSWKSSPAASTSRSAQLLAASAPSPGTSTWASAATSSGAATSAASAAFCGIRTASAPSAPYPARRGRELAGTTVAVLRPCATTTPSSTASKTSASATSNACGRATPY